MAEPGASPSSSLSGIRTNAKRNTYINNQVIFKVEDSFYTVSRHQFESQSSFFARKFAEAGNLQGNNEENPFILESCECVDFEHLLAIIEPTRKKGDWIPGEPLPLTTYKEWVSILKLATAWEMEKLRSMAIRNLSEDKICKISSVTDWICLGREYRVPQWFIKGVKSAVMKKDILTTNLDTFGKQVGLETVVRILQLRGVIQEKKAPRGRVEVHSKHLLCPRRGCSNPYATCKQHPHTILERSTGKFYQLPNTGTFTFDADRIIMGIEGESGFQWATMTKTDVEAEIAKVFGDEILSLS